MNLEDPVEKLLGLIGATRQRGPYGDTETLARTSTPHCYTTHSRIHHTECFQALLFFAKERVFVCERKRERERGRESD